jgi:hypothetical protein
MGGCCPLGTGFPFIERARIERLRDDRDLPFRLMDVV